MSTTGLSSPPIRPAMDELPTGTVRRSKARLLTLLVMIVSFSMTAVLQHVTQKRHQALVKNSGSEANLGNLNSFSLALLLGGLRGPLVMMLWNSSEAQKQEKDLEDFDSKIELIRLLQPEFISVHLFQMWNKAYNVSVQMANKPNKYTTILDAIEYGHKVDEQRPNDISIVSQMGQLYFDKLGNSQEKEYYSARIRRESFPDEKVTVPADRLGDLPGILVKANVEPARRDVLLGQAAHNGWFSVGKLTADAIRPLLRGPGITYSRLDPVVFSDTARRIRLDPMLDLEGNLLPEVITPKEPRPAGLAASAEWNDGSELQYLKKFAPFPYGIPPMAIGWNYYKRSQVIHDLTRQKHLQLSDMVVDNRPAINAKLWAESEWNIGRQAEMNAFGLKAPVTDNTGSARAVIELPAASIAPTTAFVDVAAAKEAAYHYDQVSKVSDEAIAEFNRHLQHYAANDFQSNRESIRAMKALCIADADYLRLMLLPQDQATARAEASKRTADKYNAAMLLWERLLLKHNVSDAVVNGLYPKKSRETIDALSPIEVHQLMGIVQRFLQANRQFDTESDRYESERYVQRAYLRLVQLHAEPKF
jgi:hypothetical protein